jgi:hypothetical protein
MKALVGGDCSVIAYWDESEENSIDIFASRNHEGIVCATIGLMEFNQSRHAEAEIYSEIILDHYGYDTRIGNILSTIAFYVMKDGWQVAPGVIFERMVEMYIPETKLPHVMFASPFQWQDMSEVALAEKTIYPLVAIPISEAEREMARINEGENLEELWDSQGTDVLNWSRPSAV